MLNRTSQITIPATAGALTTLDVVKDQLNLSDTSADSFLNRQIVSVSSWIASYCGRPFGRETLRDTFRLDTIPSLTTNPMWGHFAQRQARPIELSRDLLDGDSMVASVTLNGVVLDPSLYAIDAGAGLLFRLTASGGQTMWTGWPIVVEYTSGWLLPGATGRTLPPIVEDVCVDRVSTAYYARGRDPNILREMAEGVGMTIYEPPDKPDTPDTRLDPFRLATT